MEYQLYGRFWIVTLQSSSIPWSNKYGKIIINKAWIWSYHIAGKFGGELNLAV